MRPDWRSKSLGILAASLLLAGSLAAAEDDAATAALAVVEHLHAGLVALSPDTALDERYAAIAPVIESTHDLDYIAELTIRRRWSELDADERERFAAAFARLSIMTYASRFAGVSASALTIDGVEAARGGRQQVSAQIERENDTDIPLDYTLHETDTGWLIINIFADGVSDLALKRAEYQRVLQDGTIADLIDYIDAQTSGL